MITPNIPEGEVLCGFSIETPEDMERAAKDIAGKAGTAVLLKGGHELNDANDLLCEQGSCRWFRGERIDNPNTHGTGCTLSSAIACGIGEGIAFAGQCEGGQKIIFPGLCALVLTWSR